MGETKVTQEGGIKKIGDIIHFMDDNKPRVETISAVAIISGEVDLNYCVKCEKDGSKVLYFYNKYACVDSTRAFPNEEKLKESVFAPKTGKIV